MKLKRRQFLASVAGALVAVAVPIKRAVAHAPEPIRKVLGIAPTYVTQEALDSIPEHVRLGYTRRSPDTPEKRAARDAAFRSPMPDTYCWKCHKRGCANWPGCGGAFPHDYKEK